MISQHPPKYNTNDIVIYLATIELIIVKSDEWVIKDNCWRYIAYSKKTSNKVYVNENEIEIKNL